MLKNLIQKLNWREWKLKDTVGYSGNDDVFMVEDSADKKKNVVKQNGSKLTNGLRKMFSP